MTTCTVETGFLRKKPCGHVASAKCLNCDQPLCVEHAIAQLSEAGHRTGKFMCKECSVAAKEQAKALAAVERKQAASGATHKAPAHAHAAPKPAAAPAPTPTAKPAESLDALEFTPKDGKKG